MKKLILLLLLSVGVVEAQQTGGGLFVVGRGAVRYELSVVDICNGRHRISTYTYRTLARAREAREVFRKYPRFINTWIKKIR